MNRSGGLRQQFPAPVRVHMVELRVRWKQRQRRQSRIDEGRRGSLIGGDPEERLRACTAIDVKTCPADRKLNTIDDNRICINAGRGGSLRNKRKQAFSSAAVD